MKTIFFIVSSTFILQSCSSNPQPSNSTYFSGQIIDSKSCKPLSRVHINFTEMLDAKKLAEITTFTNKKGQFSFNKRLSPNRIGLFLTLTNEHSVLKYWFKKRVSDYNHYLISFPEQPSKVIIQGDPYTLSSEWIQTSLLSFDNKLITFKVKDKLLYEHREHSCRSLQKFDTYNYKYDQQNRLIAINAPDSNLSIIYKNEMLNIAIDNKKHFTIALKNNSIDYGGNNGSAMLKFPYHGGSLEKGKCEGLKKECDDLEFNKRAYMEAVLQMTTQLRKASDKGLIAKLPLIESIPWYDLSYIQIHKNHNL